MAGLSPSPLSSGDRWRLVALGLVGYYLSSFLDFLGLAIHLGGLGTLDSVSNALVRLVYPRVFMKKPIVAKQWWSLAVAYLGIVLVFIHDLGFNGTGDTRFGLGFGISDCLCPPLDTVG